MANASTSGIGPQLAGLAQGAITTVVGTGQRGSVLGDRLATQTAIEAPFSLTVDRDGNVYVADSSLHRVYKVSPGGGIAVVAGNGTAGYTADGGAATAARIDFPLGLAVDDAGNLYIADQTSHRVRKVGTTGVLTTVDNPGSRSPSDVAVDADGNLYIAEYGTNSVTRVDAKGVVTTLAGGVKPGPSGDGGPATAAWVPAPMGVAVDGGGNVYIAEFGGRVRKVDPSGVVTTVAGTGMAGDGGDGGPATAASLNEPRGLAVDDAGNLYIADSKNHRIRRVDPSGVVTTVAGTGTAGYGGDGGPATSARLSYPFGVALDRAGNLYIADSNNHRIRAVASVATMNPPSADLYGEVVVPASVTPGEGFYLGVRVGNHGPHPAPREQVTVVLTLGDPLRGPSGTTARHVTLTFTGEQLRPGQSHLDATTRVTAPADTPPGTYTCTAEIRYAGDPDPSNNTYTLPVTVVAATRPDDGPLRVVQVNVPRAAPDRFTLLNLEVRAVGERPAGSGTGPVEHRLTAPTGFAFTGGASHGWYYDRNTIAEGHDTRLEDDGRTLVLTFDPYYDPYAGTETTHRHGLILTVGIRALPDAQRGTHDDGSIAIGDLPAVPLTATID
ncbi:hypothetical protein [Embleya sp. NPDC005971]|uniref:NHL domain-containing protein n=1 Tax=Embleya sp. NPDC005971 TaxID=3156724 RepID=UPI0033CB049D